jgi:hypothetical protein
LSKNIKSLKEKREHSKKFENKSEVKNIKNNGRKENHAYQNKYSN